MKSLVIKANTSTANLGKFSCNICGGEVIGSSDLSFCPHCGEKFEAAPKKVKTSVSASLATSTKAEICCSKCPTKFEVFNSPKTSDELALSLYCPACGSEEMETVEDSVCPNCGQENCVCETDASEGFNNQTCADGQCDQEQDQVIASDAEEKQETQDSKETDETAQESDENEKVEETEKDVQDTLDNKEETVDSLQWKTVNDAENGENGTLVAFSATTGLPVYVFKKNKCNKDIQSIFASRAMISGFNQIAKTEGIGSAVVKFGGQIYNNKIIEAEHINNLATIKAKTEILPKLVECMALAAEGAMKGMYPDVRKDLYDSMINELQGSGIPKDRIEAAVRTTMGNGGTTAYASLLSKAMDLLQKDENVFAETKAMICGASNMNMSDEDIEQHRVRTALNASAIRVNDAAISGLNGGHNSEVEALRKKLNFGRFSGRR